MKINKQFITSQVICLGSEVQIQDVVQHMIEAKTPIVLIHDPKDQIIGMVTEEEIVQKLTLSDVADKLLRGVGSIMNRNVNFVSENKLHADILKKFDEKGGRYFPVVGGKGTGKGKSDIIGIVGVESILRQMVETELKNTKVEQQEIEDVDDSKVRYLGLIAKYGATLQEYPKLFEEKGFKVQIINSIDEHVRKTPDSQIPIVYDIDGFPDAEFKDTIVKVRVYRGRSVMVTSNPGLVTILRKHLTKGKQMAMVKPLDLEYANWFFKKK